MRILHLPVDVAGQAHRTAQAQRELGHAAVNLAPAHPFGYPVDRVLRRHAGRLPDLFGRVATFASVAEAFDVYHYHYHYGDRLLPRYADVRYLRARGKRVVVEFWGSDVRLPSVEAARNPHYVNAYAEDEAVNRKRIATWAELTDGEAIFSDQTFTPFLRPAFGRIHVVGQRVDVAGTEAAYPDTATRRPRLLHAPSQQAFKGTEAVEHAVSHLKAQGLDFDYVRVEGLDHASATALYRTADLVVDQLRAGAHGVFAAEAWALGKPVVGHVLPEAISGYPEGFPLIPADPDTLEDVLARWLADPAALHARGRASRAYAERVHDARRVAERLVRIYRRDLPPGAGEVIDWRAVDLGTPAPQEVA